MKFWWLNFLFSGLYLQITPYRAPERILVYTSTYGPSVDMWAVGVILLETFLGKDFLQLESREPIGLPGILYSAIRWVTFLFLIKDIMFLSPLFHFGLSFRSMETQIMSHRKDVAPDSDLFTKVEDKRVFFQFLRGILRDSVSQRWTAQQVWFPPIFFVFLTILFSIFLFQFYHLGPFASLLKWLFLEWVSGIHVLDIFC